MTTREVRSKSTKAVQDGLSTTNSYVILTRNARAGMHMALRPYLTRQNSQVLLLGGRLRIGFDYEGRGRVTPSCKKHQDMDYRQRKEALQAEYPGFTWDAADHRRSSVNAGILIAAGYGDLEAFKKQWEEVDFVGALLDEISAKAKQPLGGNKAGKNPQDAMYEELNKRFEGSIHYSFGEGQELESGVLGEISGFVNCSQRGYSRTLEAFTKKVSRFKKSAA